MFPNYVLPLVQWIHPFLSRFIPENKLLAPVPCFQKKRLLFTTDLYFLTITCRPSWFFFLFPFVSFLYIHKIIHLWFSMKKLSLYIYTLVHNKLFLYMHQNSFCLRHTVYIQTLFMFKDFFFVFPSTHQRFKSFFRCTRCSHTQEFLSTHHTHKNPSIHMFLLKAFFLFSL